MKLETNKKNSVVSGFYSIKSGIFAFSAKKIQPLMNANSREFLYLRPFASIRGLNIFGCGLSALGIIQAN